MSNIKFINTLMCLAAFLAFSCSRENGGEDTGKTGGTSSLHIAVKGTATKADSDVESGDPDMRGAVASAKDGDIMKTLSLWLVSKNDGKVAAFKSLSPDAATEEVLIEDIQRGDYRLYVLANCTDLDADYTAGKTVDNNFMGKLLPEITSGNAPSFDDESGMPCSVVQDIAVAAGANYVEAHLLRCVGKLSFQFRNNISDYSVAIANIGLSAVNPTTGYLFDTDDHSIPASATDVAFPDLNENMFLFPNTESEMFTTYLYETSDATSDSGISFNLFAALYGADAMPDDIGLAERFVYSVSDNISSSPVAGSVYVLRSRTDDTQYVGIDNNDKLVLQSFTSDEEMLKSQDFSYCLWAVTDPDNGKLLNASTGGYITLDGETAGHTQDDAKATTFAITNKSGVFQFKNTGGYSLTYDEESKVVGSQGKESTSDTQWNMRKVESSGKEQYFKFALYEIPRVSRPISYIDQYGNSQKLTRIGRNEHITVTVNIFYNKMLGQFDFQVEEWRKKSAETTFD